VRPGRRAGRGRRRGVAGAAGATGPRLGPRPKTGRNGEVWRRVPRPGLSPEVRPTATRAMNRLVGRTSRHAAENRS
jgi:hypothetical protein